jgi:hypothetical protein
VGEFHVASDGHRMTCRQFARASAESFHVYMLGQALSCALINQGIEPFHATAVAVNGAAVAFVGGNGFGKSTLAAAFVRRGFPLVTDDMLVVDEAGGRLLAHPGPPRLKLFPQIARRVLGVTDDLGAMNSETPKRILPLTGSSACPAPIPLGAIYILAAPRHTARCVGAAHAEAQLAANGATPQHRIRRERPDETGCGGHTSRGRSHRPCDCLDAVGRRHTRLRASGQRRGAVKERTQP